MLRLKKILASFLILTMLSTAVLVSCGKKGDSDEANKEDHPADSTEHPSDSTDHPKGEHPKDTTK